MKTVIPEYKELNDHWEKVDYIFHHGKDVSISRQVRPLAENANIYSGIKSDPLTEMEFIVIRFPKHLKPDYSSDFYSSLRRVFYHQWEDAGDDIELLLHEGNSWRVLNGLEEAGVFRFDTKVYPNFKEGLYLPHYRYASKFWQKGLNFVTIVLSIPQVTGMLIKEVYVDRKEKRKNSKEKSVKPDVQI